MPGPSILDKKKTAVVILDYQINLIGSFQKKPKLSFYPEWELFAGNCP